MKYLLFFLPICFLSATAYADDIIKPGSLYCDAVISVETKTYHSQRARADKMLASMIAQAKSFLSKITPAERVIIQVEGSTSDRLVNLESRLKATSNSFSNNYTGCLPGWVGYDVENCGFFPPNAQFATKVIPRRRGLYKNFRVNIKTDDEGKPFQQIYMEHDLIGEDDTFELRVSISNPEKEEKEIKESSVQNYLAPTLIDYLKKKIDPGCIDEELISKINDADRTSGKDVPTHGKVKTKSDKSSGAVKN